jgi:hypothetical protein
MRMVYFSVFGLFALAQSTTVPAPPATGGALSQPPPSPAEVLTPKDAKERMDLARKVNGLQGLDLPWHLKASYEVFGADGKSSDTGPMSDGGLTPASTGSLCTVPPFPRKCMARIMVSSAPVNKIGRADR